MKKSLVFLLVLCNFFVFSNFNLMALAINDSFRITLDSTKDNLSTKVLAISDFSNDTGEVKLDYLKKGLANTLITSLGVKSNGNLSIVERNQLEALVKEMGLANSGLIDVSTAAELGNALGATQVVVGGIIKVGTLIRLNVRVIEVKTSRLLFAVNENGASEGELLNLVDNVAEKIVSQLCDEVKQPIAVATPIPTPTSTLVPTATPTSTPVIENTTINNNNTEQKDEIKKDEGIPTWVWIAGGVALVAIGVTVVIIMNSSTKTPIIGTKPPILQSPIKPRTK